MGETVVLAMETVSEGVAIRLFRSTDTDAGMIEVFDLDAERTYDLTRYPTFDAARTVFLD